MLTISSSVIKFYCNAQKCYKIYNVKIYSKLNTGQTSVEMSTFCITHDVPSIYKYGNVQQAKIKVKAILTGTQSSIESGF